jgi:hypothetical protein
LAFSVSQALCIVDEICGIIGDDKSGRALKRFRAARLWL